MPSLPDDGLVHAPQQPEPLPPAIVERLVRAGLSHGTVVALDRWKAQELVELLRLDRARVSSEDAADGARSSQDPG